MAEFKRPTRDELTQAEAWAIGLLRKKKGDNYVPQTPEEIQAGKVVSVTDLAVYVFGLEGWVCPHCLGFTSMAGKMPLAPANCHSCGRVLQQ
jgi:hypothetical protein